MAAFWFVHEQFRQSVQAEWWHRESKNVHALDLQIFKMCFWISELRKGMAKLKKIFQNQAKCIS
jgi:hypothetical protein